MSFVYDRRRKTWIDKTSGYCFDDITQLYYHPPTGLHYRWDMVHQQYVQTDERGVIVSHSTASSSTTAAAAAVVSATASSSTAASSSSSAPVKKLKPEAAAAADGSKQEIKLVIKGVKTMPKDLLRWNKRKEETIVEPSEAETSVSQPSSAGAMTSEPAGAVLSSVTVSATNASTGRVQSEVAAINRGFLQLSWSGEPAAAVVATATPATAAPNVPTTGKTYIDFVKLICTLCQRKFITADQLRRHESESDLHKKNLQIEEFKQINREQIKAASAAELAAARREVAIANAAAAAHRKKHVPSIMFVIRIGTNVRCC